MAINPRTLVSEGEGTDIRILNLSTRITNALIDGDIRTIQQLTGHTARYVRNLDGVGKKGFYDVKQVMIKHGLSFSESDEPMKQPYTPGQRDALIKTGLQWMVDERDALIRSYSVNSK